MTVSAALPTDVVLLNPPRTGLADAVPTTLESVTPRPRAIVYVSCNPATLARDAGLLVHQAGYACKLAGVVNMFPHTAHVESIAHFVKSE